MKYILLTTETKLSDEEKDKWLSIVLKFSPSGSVDKKEIITQNKSSFFNYKIFLKKELSEIDAEFIVTAWDNFYKNDFEIETNFLDTNEKLERDYSIEESLQTELIERLSKFLHNRWVNDRISEGWRYNNHYNLQEKTHPSLRDWDSLPAEYRKKIKITNEKLFSVIESHPSLFD